MARSTPAQNPLGCANRISSVSDGNGLLCMDLHYKMAIISASKLNCFPAKGWLKSNQAPSSLIDCNTPAYCAPLGALNSIISPGANSGTSSVLANKTSMPTHWMSSGLCSPNASFGLKTAERFSPTFAPNKTFSKQGAN